MGIKERKEREKADRRETIINAAISVFIQKGYSHTTMDDIAEKAEFSKGTLYLYFKSKAELFFAIWATLVDRMNDFVEKNIEDRKSGREKLLIFRDAFLDFYRNNPEMFELMIYSGGEMRELFEKHQNEMDALIEEKEMPLFMVFQKALAQGIEDGSVTNINEANKYLISVSLLTHGLYKSVIEMGPMFEQYYGVKPDEIIEYGNKIIYSAEFRDDK